MQNDWTPHDTWIPRPDRPPNPILEAASVGSMIVLGLVVLYVAVNLPGPALATEWHGSAAPQSLPDVIHTMRGWFVFGLFVDASGLALCVWLATKKQPLVALVISAGFIALTMICSVLAFFVVGLGAAFNNSV